MNKATLEKFRTLLTDKRDEILKKAKQTLEQDMTLDTDDLPDEMDLASSEYLQSFTFLSLAVDTLTDEVEPFLLRRHFIVRTREAVVTPLAYRHLGLAEPMFEPMAASSAISVSCWNDDPSDAILCGSTTLARVLRGGA